MSDTQLDQLKRGNIDPLTGVLTHSALLEALTALRSRCRQHNTTVSLIVFDLDGFRSFNQAYSHTAGDLLLRRLGRSIQDRCDETAVLGHYQWDRFVLILPDTSEGDAFKKADRLRGDLFRNQIKIAGFSYRPRIRVGVTQSQNGFLESEQDLIDRALVALARAKELGGNQTFCWSWTSNRGLSRRRLERASIDEVSSWASRIQQQLKRSYAESAQALVAAVEAKDPHTRQHSLTVSFYCEQIARRMKLPANQIESLRLAALLHDIGKIAVPDAILQKPGPLSRQEFEVVKRHPGTAVEILAPASFLRAESSLILHHHERFDGKGYPEGLAGEDIPLGARILNVADSLDAMLSPRSYKKAFSIQQVKDELRTCAGAQFDPEASRVAHDWLENEPQAILAERTAPGPT